MLAKWFTIYPVCLWGDVMSNIGYVKVGAISPEITVANPSKNVKAAIDGINFAAQQGCQLVCLPELFFTGSTCGNLFKNETLYKKCNEALAFLLNETATQSTVIIIGSIVRVGSDFFNCGIVLQEGKILGIVPKLYTKNNPYFTSGLMCNSQEIKFLGKNIPFGQLLFSSEDLVFGVEMGDDSKSPISPCAKMVLNGAQIIFNPTAEVCVLGSNESNEENIKSISKRCICGYVSASTGVGESSTDFIFSGVCTVAENSKILQSAKFPKENGCAIGVIDVQKLNAVRRNEGFSKSGKIGRDAVIEFNLPVLKIENITVEYNKHPFIPQNGDVSCKMALEIQCAGLKKRIKHIKAEKLVLGISGGLDSTLALLVAHKAAVDLGMPEKSVLCITMPGFGTTDRTYNNAVNLVHDLGAELREINIKKASVQHMNDIGHDVNIHDITYENTQARERTQILMDIANKEGGLLVGTGDLSEAALGWCTYNGDHMSMYNVNCGVPKTFIRCIVDYCARNSEGNVSRLLESILNTPVSPELLPPDEQGKIAQKTEDTLGPYEVHDFLIYHFVKYGYSREKLLFILQKAFEDEYEICELEKWLNIFLKRFFVNQFKRSCVPDGPKVFDVGLSPRGDWQMPSDADFSEWMK